MTGMTHQAWLLVSDHISPQLSTTSGFDVCTIKTESIYSHRTIHVSILLAYLLVLNDELNDPLCGGTVAV